MSGFIEMLLDMSIAGAFIAAVIILLRIPLRKAPRRYSYMLWAILGIRLLCPFSLPSPASLFNLFSASTDSGRMTFAVPGNIAAPTGNITVTPAQTAVTVPTESHAEQPDILPTVLFWVWAAGAAAFAAYWLISWIGVRIRVKGAVRVEDGIYECGGISTAFVLGLFRPAIYLPTGLSARDREFIIAHERTHIRRRDYIIKPLAMLALGIHWFNPMAWVAFFLMVRDMEISCDERVIRNMDTDARKEYAAALLGMSVRQNRLSGVLAFGESSIKQRIKSVLSPKKPTLWISIAAVILIAAAAVCLLTNSSRKPEESSPDTSTTQSDSQPEPEIAVPQTTGESDSAPTEETSQASDSVPAQDIPELNEDNAAETVNSVLSSFWLRRNDNGAVIAGFSMPDLIPQDPEGKTKLVISLGVDYYLGDGTYSHTRVLDYSELNPGEDFTTEVLAPEDDREFQSTMLRAAFMTEVDESVYSEYYADYVALDSDQIDAGTVTAPRAEIDGDSVHYYFSGDSWTVTLGDLPEGFTLATEENHTAGIPVISIMSGGAQIGTMSMYSFGTTQPEELANVDPAGNTMPMQIYSGIGLSNMVDYGNGYLVVAHSPTGSTAVAFPLDRDGNAVGKCVYAFDYSKVPYFVMVSFDSGVVSDEQLTDIACSVVIG